MGHLSPPSYSYTEGKRPFFSIPESELRVIFASMQNRANTMCPSAVTPALCRVPIRVIYPIRTTSIRYRVERWREFYVFLPSLSSGATSR